MGLRYVKTFFTSISVLETLQVEISYKKQSNTAGHHVMEMEKSRMLQ